MSEKDKRQRLQFAQKMQREMLQNVAIWKNEVFFYLDGVSFVHKFNPQMAQRLTEQGYGARSRKGFN